MATVNSSLDGVFQTQASVQPALHTPAQQVYMCCPLTTTTTDPSHNAAACPAVMYMCHKYPALIAKNNHHKM